MKNLKEKYLSEEINLPPHLLFANLIFPKISVSNGYNMNISVSIPYFNLI